MAGSVTKDLIDLSFTTTANSTLADWVGSSEGIDDEVYKQAETVGTDGSYTYQTGKNTLATAVFTPPTNINMTANYTTPHLYWTMRCDVMTFCEALNTGATNSGLMIRVTDGSGNYVQWHLEGSDTWDGGWRNFVLDLTRTSDIHSSSGTLSLADVDTITWYTDNSNSGTIRIIDNTWIDCLRYGDGLQANSITTEAFDFTDVALDDALVANYYGVLQNVDGVLFAQGLITLGDLTDTNGTNFISSAETVYFKDQPVSTSHYGVVGVEATSATNPTDIDISGLVCKTVGVTGAEFDFSDADLNSLSLVGSTLLNMGVISFGSGTIDTTKFSSCGATTLSGCTTTACTWDTSGLVTQGSATITGCTFDSASGTVALAVNALDSVTKCVFISDGTGHAVDLGTISSTQSLSWDNTESGYAATDGTTGNETILVSVASGITLTINVAATGSTPTIKNDGTGTVSVVAGQKIFTVLGLELNTEVTIVTADTTTVLHHTEDASTSDGNGKYKITYTHSGGASVDVLIHHVDYVPDVNNSYGLTLPSTDSSIQVSMTLDGNYENP